MHGRRDHGAHIPQRHTRPARQRRVPRRNASVVRNPPLFPRRKGGGQAIGHSEGEKGEGAIAPARVLEILSTGGKAPICFSQGGGPHPAEDDISRSPVGLIPPPPPPFSRKKQGVSRRIFRDLQSGGRRSAHVRRRHEDRP